MIEDLVDRLTRAAKKKVRASGPVISVTKNGNLVLFRAGNFSTLELGEKAMHKKYREWLLALPMRFYLENSIEHVVTTEDMIVLRTTKNPKK